MSKNSPKIGRLLLFGGTGSIGTEIRNFYSKEGWQVVVVTRRPSPEDFIVSWDPFDKENKEALDDLLKWGPFEAICWAQGANCNDSIYSFDQEVHMKLYEANVLFILRSLNQLLSAGVLAKPSRLCVVSSIWQNYARQNKLSYSVTKAALQGLVMSLANDLGRDGHLINAVLPGVIDTPMTRNNLTDEQISNISKSTQFDRLPSLKDVASAVYSLTSYLNTGVTAQFVNVDLGFTHVRVI